MNEFNFFTSPTLFTPFSTIYSDSLGTNYQQIFLRSKPVLAGTKETRDINDLNKRIFITNCIGSKSNLTQLYFDKLFLLADVRTNFQKYFEPEIWEEIKDLFPYTFLKKYVPELILDYTGFYAGNLNVFDYDAQRVKARENPDNFQFFNNDKDAIVNLVIANSKDLSHVLSVKIGFPTFYELYRWLTRLKKNNQLNYQSISKKVNITVFSKKFNKYAK